MAIEGRTWNNSDGKRNFPSGEIFTGPVEDSVEGHVRFTFPVVTGGREVSDVRIRFAGGKVVEASAGKNEDVLIAALDTDEGARYLGEIAFGTNFGLDRFTKKILLDEKIGGTVHMALGNGYPDTGSQQQIRDPLGPDLRYPARRPRHRRWRGFPRRRPIPALGGPAVTDKKRIYLASPLGFAASTRGFMAEVIARLSEVVTVVNPWDDTSVRGRLRAHPCPDRHYRAARRPSTASTSASAPRTSE